MSLMPIRRVLVIDADFDHLLRLFETLKLLGIPEIEASDSIEAGSQRALSTQFDLVIAHWEPGAGSMSALFSNGPLLLLIPSEAQARSPGFSLALRWADADLALPKPFTRSALFKTLNDLVAGPAGRRLKIVELPKPRAIRLVQPPQSPHWLPRDPARLEPARFTEETAAPQA